MHRVPFALAAGLAASLAGLAANLVPWAPAFAHAFLDHAVPSVGGTVSASPGELTLTFTQKVVVALSKVSIARAGGGATPAGRLAGEGGSASETLHLALAGALPPGSYVVSWRVVSVDTHPTAGTYKFTVAP